MYHPYFRGKQNELIAVREMAATISAANFIPIIEPVKEQLSGLKKTLQALSDVNASVIVIVNPQYGDHRDDGGEIISFLDGSFTDFNTLMIGVLLTEEMTTQDALDLCNVHTNRNIALIHAGFTDARDLAASIAQLQNVTTSIFSLEGSLNF